MWLAMPVLSGKTISDSHSQCQLWDQTILVSVLIVLWICYVTWARNSEPLITLQSVTWNNDIASQGLLEVS